MLEAQNQRWTASSMNSRDGRAAGSSWSGAGKQPVLIELSSAAMRSRLFQQ